MSGPGEAERAARAVLTWVAEPGDAAMGALLSICPPAEIVAALIEGRMPRPVVSPSGGPVASPSGGPLASPSGGSAPSSKGGSASAVSVGSGTLTGVGSGTLTGVGSGTSSGGGAVASSGGGPAASSGGDPAASSGGDPVANSGGRPAAPFDDRCDPQPGIGRLDRALSRWAARLGDVPPQTTLDAWRRDGIRLVIPGDAEWPGQLDVLGEARPWGLWVRGHADLRYACLRSVSVVGTRAATAYGAHVSAEFAIALAERGWTVVSGGAFGIDSCAHRGALAVQGTTVAVLACGVDRAYPQGHCGLFHSIRERGAVVSEWPPGRMPTRPGFLVRNRVIAALSRGTVVVEAALRSGALSTARHAHDQGRPLMAVPGPVTSAQSAGCHEAIREWGAVCVTSARDVIGLLEFSGDGPPQRQPGPVLARDLLDPVMTRVLEAVPVRAGRGPARIAVAAGVDFDTVMRCLGGLAAGGFVERCDRGWRLRRSEQDRHVGSNS